jgi:hypothetical protein
MKARERCILSILFLAGFIGLLAIAIAMTIDQEGFFEFLKETDKQAAENGWVDQDGIFHPPGSTPRTGDKPLRSIAATCTVATWVVTFVLAAIGSLHLLRLVHRRDASR